MRALAHVLGLDNPSGYWYLWWSGFFGDVTIIGGALGLYHKHNCHERGCRRIGKHLVEGTPWCSRHRPS